MQGGPGPGGCRAPRRPAATLEDVPPRGDSRRPCSSGGTGAAGEKGNEGWGEGE